MSDHCTLPENQKTIKRHILSFWLSNFKKDYGRELHLSSRIFTDMDLGRLCPNLHESDASRQKDPWASKLFDLCRSRRKKPTFENIGNVDVMLRLEEWRHSTHFMIENYWPLQSILSVYTIWVCEPMERKFHLPFWEDLKKWQISTTTSGCASGLKVRVV